MNPHLEPQAATDQTRPMTSSATRDVDEQALARKLERRRKVLIGGVVASGLLTIGNRPALANGGACTVSAVASANPSHTQSGPCGNSPGCWKNHDFALWADGATFMNVSVPYTHSTVLSNLFSILTQSTGNVKFSIDVSAQLGQEIDASNHCQVNIYYADNSEHTLLDSGQLTQLVAGLLNSFFFGNSYTVANVKTIINNYFTTVYNDAVTNTSSSLADITTQTNNLFGASGSITVANNSYTENCT